ncbi:MAG: hypothetical protein SPD54_10490 [Parabacteroides sp.]|nr:hypothetical protein [Parabacteroides sp.]
MKYLIYHLYISINFANNTVDYQQSERISPESMNGYRPEYAPRGDKETFYYETAICSC